MTAWQNYRIDGHATVEFLGAITWKKIFKVIDFVVSHR